MYIVGIEDRHADIDVHLYFDREKAIEFARNQAKESDRHGDYEEHDYAGWIFHATYSCEGDSTWVVEREPADG